MSLYVKESVLDLIHWITEREQIRLRKERGAPRPWTMDPILAEWRFCNVNRCDDRETKWIFKHIIAEFSSSPVLWFNLAIARFINWSPSLKDIGYFHVWDRDHFVKTMAKLCEGKAYTGAYMIPAGPPGVIKHEYLADAVFSKLWEIRRDAPMPGSMCLDWSEFFRRVPLMGDFLRNQIITDMKYSHHLPKDTTKDWKTFVLAGPGTQRGLNRMLGRPLEMKWNQKGHEGDAAYELHKMREWLMTAGALGGVFDDLNNLSNCMCEFDKYRRVKLNEGKPRSKYVPNA